MKSIFITILLITFNVTIAKGIGNNTIANNLQDSKLTSGYVLNSSSDNNLVHFLNQSIENKYNVMSEGAVGDITLVSQLNNTLKFTGFFDLWFYGESTNGYSRETFCEFYLTFLDGSLSTKVNCALEHPPEVW